VLSLKKELRKYEEEEGEQERQLKLFVKGGVDDLVKFSL